MDSAVKQEEIMEGYDVEVAGDVFKDAYCIICLKLMRDAIQMNCGHGMCKACFHALSESCRHRNIELVCPSCRQNVNKDQVFHNSMLDRIIAAIKVKCTNNELGCEWNGELQMMEDHQSTCKYQMVECPFDGCNEEMQRQALHKHKSICEYRVIQCDYCTESFLPNELQNHFEVCEYYPVTCSNQLCSELVPKCKVENHLLKDCLYQHINCSFHSIGCSVKVLRKDLNQHSMEYNQQHMLFLLQDSHLKNKMIEQLQDENKMIRLEAAESDQKLLTKIELLENDIITVREEAKVTDNELNKYKEQYENIILKLINIELKFQTLTCLTPDELTGSFTDNEGEKKVAKKEVKANIKEKILNDPSVTNTELDVMICETFNLDKVERALTNFKNAQKQNYDECFLRELSSLSGVSETVKSGIALPLSYWSGVMESLKRNSKIYNFQQVSRIERFCDNLKNFFDRDFSVFGKDNIVELKNCVYIRYQLSSMSNKRQEFKSANHEFELILSHNKVCVAAKEIKEVFSINQNGERTKLEYYPSMNQHECKVCNELMQSKYIVNGWFLLEIVY